MYVKLNVIGNRPIYLKETLIIIAAIINGVVTKIEQHDQVDLVVYVL